MQEENVSQSKEIQQLIETNEALLRSKGRLQNEIVELKKSIIDQRRNVKLIEEQQEKIAALNIEISNHVVNTALLSSEIDDLKKQISALISEIAGLQNENLRLQKLSWFKKMLGRK
mgnify:CR=1 FL=1